MPFADFSKLAWQTVDPAPLKWSWHLDEMCAVCEEVARDRRAGKPRDVSINVPPGSTKSRIVSVLFQPWVWGPMGWPESSWITASFDDALAGNLSAISLALVRSRWYQDRWPMGLVRDAASHWGNSSGGERFAVGIGTRITGEHGHFLIGDDLIKEQLARLGTPSQIASAVSRSVNYWFGTLPTRAIDYVAGSVLVQQRLHRDDPSGVAIRKHGYEAVIFPARFNPAKADKRDHRTKAGELLNDRLTDELLDKIVRRIGPTAAAAQMDQDPAALGGPIITEEHLSHRYAKLPWGLARDIEQGRAEGGRRYGLFVDATFKGKESSDWVVIQLWCADGEARYLVDQERAQLGFRASKELLRRWRRQYPFAEIWLEDAANAAAIEDDLVAEGLGVHLEPVGGGTLVRTQRVEGVWASGSVWLPAGASWMDGESGFVAEHLAFDGTGVGHDDQVSASSLALCHFLDGESNRDFIEAMKAFGG